MFAGTILTNAATLTPAGVQKNNQAIVIEQEVIAWCGDLSALPAKYAVLEDHFEDCQGELVTPGLIDCHTHLVYAGNRANEFQLRLEGMSYQDIAKQGGGILSTVQATREASVAQLVHFSMPRLIALKLEGVTTVEIKSGYGLTLEAEMRMLEAARELGRLSGMRIKTTFLGAHALPMEFKNNKQAYVDYLCTEMLPAVVERDLADAVDVFCETIGFTLTQTEQIFQKAHDLGLPIKCHAEQLSLFGASALAASMGALSCDHLEFLDEKGAGKMQEQGTVAVLLPGAYYFLRENRTPPVALLRELGVGMALATDCNPGSSPTTSLLLMMSMACRFFGLTVSEALAGVTFQAARALGIDQETGSISVGLSADLVRWKVKDATELCYYFGYLIPHTTMIAGYWQKGN